MDPQKLSQLDPKLREAYQRVMGTPIPQPPPMPDPTPAPEPTPPPVGETTPTIQEPPVSQPQPAIPQPEPPPAGGSIPEPTQPQQPTVQPTNFVQMNSEVATAQSSPNFSTPTPMSQGQTIAIKKKSSVTPILVGLAALFFVAVYTLFWTKIFNFKLPFLP